MIRIFVYKTPDGRFGADFKHDFASRMGGIVKTYRLASEKDILELITSPGELCPERIISLCERLLTEDFDNLPTENVTSLQLNKRGFFGRLKWALFRK